MTPLVRYQTVVYDSARWDGFAFRPDDIVISTPPKCGTTWTQMMCALLIFQTPRLPRSLDLLSPWLDMLTRPLADVVADLDAQPHRRFIKTHTPLDGLPFDERVTYVCVGRDPRDVALSMDSHVTNLDQNAFFAARDVVVGADEARELFAQVVASRPPTARERFWLWADDTTPPQESASSLQSTLHHLESFWNARGAPNVVMLHYGDLKRDLGRQMRALADRLGIAVPEERWPELVRAATFEEMRRNADGIVPDVTNAIWRDNREFFHRGTSGQWRNVLDDEDLRRYARRVAELVTPDLATWAHQGPIIA